MTPTTRSRRLFHRIAVEALIAAVLLSFRTTAVADEANARFAIRIASLSGKEHGVILQNSWQQMSHPRVSPDKVWVTFTRYNEKHWGVAQEADGYENTEIDIVRLDGREVRTIVPPKAGILNCNSSWVDEGRSLVWISTDNEQRVPWLMKVELATGEITRLPTPKHLFTTDPHIVGEQVVFPVVDKESGVDAIWSMGIDGSGLRQLTRPQHPGGFRWFALPAGDYDPKLSPDGERVAFMRLTKRSDWKIYIIDSDGSHERNLSGKHEFDIVPTWSSDGALLLFSHVDTRNPAETGLYSMKPDGSERVRVLATPQQIPNQPDFYPNSGSGPGALFVYQTMKIE